MTTLCYFMQVPLRGVHQVSVFHFLAGRMTRFPSEPGIVLVSHTFCPLPRSGHYSLLLQQGEKDLDFSTILITKKSPDMLWENTTVTTLCYFMQVALRGVRESARSRFVWGTHDTAV